MTIKNQTCLVLIIGEFGGGCTFLHGTCSLHLMFQTMLPLRLHEFQSQTSAYWVSYKTFKSLTLALVGRDNTGCACIIAPVHGLCLHYITQRCYYAIQSIQPSTDRTHTYIHVYILLLNTFLWHINMKQH